MARSIALAAKDRQLAVLVNQLAADLSSTISSVGGGWFSMARRCGWMRWMFFRFMDFMVPGIVLHYILRKRGIEAEVRKSLATGAAQVAVLGAGYDLLAWMLHEEFPEVNFIEFDHPATQAPKRSALPESRNFHYGEIDLEKEAFGEVASSCPHFNKGVPTVFIAEGLTMYLREGRVAELLADFSRLSGDTGRVIFTFMEKDQDGSIDFRDQRRGVGTWLRWRSEPFLWGIRREDLSGFLELSSLGNIEVADDARLRAQFLTPLGLGDLRIARGECLCYCSPTHR
ncbi:MAG: class I SAM-dependent methyltransferase [Luteolibacter sp.]